ncbi:MAG TPA: HNH endonuclease [Verrucomicrobiae bacterium]|nr:HNH endonuclease [Verrucomicrobiae bacterium]
MTSGARRHVRERAGNRCEYCHLRQEDSPLALLHIEHVIPRVHGGDDDLDNLALACIDCNLHKGPNLTGVDPETRQTTELFHPRHHRWEDHFEWIGISLLGKSPIGRTTARVLNVNSEDQLTLRSLGGEPSIG